MEKRVLRTEGLVWLLRVFRDTLCKGFRSLCCT